MHSSNQSTGHRYDMSIKVLELVLVAGVALGLGFWQLYDVNRELRKDREKRDSGSVDADSVASGGTEEPQRDQSR